MCVCTCNGRFGILWPSWRLIPGRLSLGFAPLGPAWLVPACLLACLPGNGCLSCRPRKASAVMRTEAVMKPRRDEEDDNDDDDVDDNNINQRTKDAGESPRHTRQRTDIGKRRFSTANTIKISLRESLVSPFYAQVYNTVDGVLRQASRTANSLRLLACQFEATSNQYRHA